MILLLTLLLMAQQAATPSPPVVKFAGEISYGETFEREFGSGLLFRLSASQDPQTPGWTIEVRPKNETRPEVELVWVATPPYRFFNPRYLEISYGYSAREIVAMNERGFSFVRDPRDYDRAAEAVRTLLWPYTFSEEQVKRAEETLNQVPTCQGVLRIVDHRLGPDPQTSERIEWLKFEVELCRPSER